MIELTLHDLIWISVIVLSPVVILIQKLYSKRKSKADVFLSQIKNLRKLYRSYPKEKHCLFDKELEDILINNEKIGNQLTLTISLEILYSLMEMCKFEEAKKQFYAIQSQFTLDHPICSKMIAFLMKEELKTEASIILMTICLRYINWKSDDQSSIEEALCSAAISNEFDLIVNIFQNKCGERVSSSSIEFILMMMNNAGKSKKILQLYPYLIVYQKKTPLANEIFTQVFIIEKRIDLINEYTKELFEVMNEKTLCCLLNIYTKNLNVSKAEEVYELINDLANASIGAGKIMTMYNRTKKYIKVFEVFRKLSSPTIVHYQLALKGLFQAREIVLAFEVFERLNEDKSCIIDKQIYELVIKACFDFKMVTKAYELLLESIYSNIKLEKYIYEEIIFQLDSSEVIGRQKMIVQLYDIFKISNMSSDAGLMSKFKVLLEKDISNSCDETNESSSFKEVNQSI